MHAPARLVRAHPHPEGAQALFDVGRRDADSEQALQLPGAQLHRPDARQLVIEFGGRDRPGRAAGDPEQQPRRQRDCALLAAPVDAALEALAGIGLQSVAARPARDRGG